MTTKLQVLCEIERRLRWESAELVQLFNSQEPQPAKNPRQRARARALLAAAATKGLVLLGPRMLTEAEVRTQQRVPQPRTAALDTAIARRTGPVAGPAALTAPIGVANILVAPSTIVATPLCRAA